MFTPGGQLTYTLTVTNNGAGVSSGFVVNDVVPAPLTNVAAEGCTVTGNEVACVSGTLAVGASQEFTVTADAPPGVTDCVTNTATVLGNEADPAAANNSSSVTSCPAVPAVTASKSVDPASGTSVTAGQSLTYTLTFENTGTPRAPWITPITWPRCWMMLT